MQANKTLDLQNPLHLLHNNVYLLGLSTEGIKQLKRQSDQTPALQWNL